MCERDEIESVHVNSPLFLAPHFCSMVLLHSIYNLVLYLGSNIKCVVVIVFTILSAEYLSPSRYVHILFNSLTCL